MEGPYAGPPAFDTQRLGGHSLASTGKRKTTMAKLQRERRLLERRIEKKAKKDARKRAAAAGETLESPASDDLL
jgi:hypothetical protein